MWEERDDLISTPKILHKVVNGIQSFGRKDLPEVSETSLQNVCLKVEKRRY